jgi:hypothetical protein
LVGGKGATLKPARRPPFYCNRQVSFLAPEDIPGFIASLAAPPQPSDRVVKGYRVKGSFTQMSATDTEARQEALARLIAKSLKA